MKKTADFGCGVHSGTDWDLQNGNQGTYPLLTMAPAIVYGLNDTDPRYSKCYGLYTMANASPISLYAHMSSLAYSQNGGQAPTAGTVIGYSGATGTCPKAAVHTHLSMTTSFSNAVVIAVDPADDTLLNGAAATVEIAVASDDQVLTVPLSALHSDTSGDTVDVLSGDEVTATPVEVGTVGADVVEITSGLALGDVVVIAELGAEIASDGDTSTDAGLTGLSGDTSTQGGPTFNGGTLPEGFTPAS